MRHVVRTAWLLILVGVTARGAEVSGRVALPDICSPGVSPAVVTLEPRDGAAQAPSSTSTTTSADVALIDQQGLQFVPRVQAIRLGQPVRFTNGDAETHNVHVVTPGVEFNQSLSPRQAREFTPAKPGLVRLVCDVHSHMRGYIVVADSPWVQVCTRLGNYRFDDVPDGRYTLHVWHEMGEPITRDVTVEGGKAVALGTLTVTVPTPPPGTQATAPARRWGDVLEKISLLLASSLDAATRPDEFKKARRLAEDAYWGEFEASEMETAVRTHLGIARAGALERQFLALVADVRPISEGTRPPAHMADLTRLLLLDLARASDDLNRKGVTDRDHLFAGAAPPVSAASAPGRDTLPARLSALRQGFDRIAALADRGEADDASSAMSAVYFDEFEPLERFLAIRHPQDVRPLESRFNDLRGAIGAGLKGEPLAARLRELHGGVVDAVKRGDEQPAGAFGPAFLASLITIVREGAEIILVLAMLIALVSKTGQAGALRAIAWGVGLALFASAATAVGLNLLVASAQGRSREILEGAVMLTAAGLLFYVSYWLIAQSESKRWMGFLKRQAQRGMELGGRRTLALTAFLAVYREGAETALMYQALIGGQGGSRAGLLGLAVGLGVGVVLLAIIAAVIRATSVRVPLRTFFQVTGVVLFALAVVFAGNGIFELQSSGILKITPLAWLGHGLPILGVHPNVQAVSAQALLLAGAGLALVLMLTGDEPAATRSRNQSPRVGV